VSTSVRATAAQTGMGVPLASEQGEGQVAGAAQFVDQPSRRRRDRSYRRGLVIADLVSVVVVLGALTVGPWLPHPGIEVILLAPALILLHKLGGLYERDELVLNKTTLDEAPALIQTSGVFTLLVSVAVAAAATGLSAAAVVWVWVATSALALSGRALSRRIVRSWSLPERCLLMGTPRSIETLRRRLASREVDAVIVAELPLQHGDGVGAVAARPEALLRLLHRRHVDRAIIAPEASDAGDMLDVIRLAKAAGVTVTILPRLLEVVGSSVEFDQIEGMTMLGVRKFGLSRSSRVVKRAFDLVVSSAMLLILAPVLAAVAVAIKLDSAGPVLFRQTRIGRADRPFQILKFRSMTVDAEARKPSLLRLNETQGIFKLADDPRVTRVGRFIRSTCIDEAPQLLNVLRGEMSLVGPRPLVVDEDALVCGLGRSRSHLTPGMTGRWQILGAARVPLDEMIGIDYLYVANWTLWEDVKILLRTVRYVMMRRGL
jgi:exopolysaccharide biosynthesis polyprenyl glycosylphosphotransferase